MEDGLLDVILIRDGDLIDFAKLAAGLAERYRDDPSVEVHHAEVATGGWRDAVDDDPAARGEHAFHLPAFAWVSAGLAAQMALIRDAGFVVAAAALFCGVARGFGSKRPVRDAAMGFVLGLAVYLFFVRVLNVGLPGGWLAPLLGVAGL